MTVGAQWVQASALARLGRPRPGLGLLLLPGLICGMAGLVLLGRKSLWLDESVSATLAQLDWSVLGDVLVRREANMALYHLALKVWTEAFGASEFAVRSLSVLCAAGSACAVSALAARLLGVRVAVASALLYGLNPAVLVFAQTARGYALCLLLVVVAELLVVHAVQGRSRSAWIGYAVVTAAAIYTNVLVVLLAVANLIAVASLPRLVVRRRDLAVSTSLLLMLVLPLLLRVPQANAGGVGWIAGTAGGELVRRLNSTIPAPVALSLLGVAALGAVAVVVRRGRSSMAWWSRFRIVLPASWLLTPTLGILALSIGYRPLLVPRYLIYCLPPLVILAAAALVRLLPGKLALAGLAVALSVSLALDVAWYRANPEEDWRSAVAEVTARRRATDAVLYYPAYTRLPFDYYRSRSPRPIELELVYPPRGPEVGDELQALGPVPIDRSVVAASARRVDHLWLVLRREQAGPSTGEQGVRAGLEDAGLVAVGQRCFTHACVAEFTRP
jgi:mannosyltransferase